MVSDAMRKIQGNGHTLPPPPPPVFWEVFLAKLLAFFFGAEDLAVSRISIRFQRFGV
jgi:hypothetical protein